MRATCRDCDIGFDFDPTWYADQHLLSPSRCPACRRQRRASRQEGRIVGVDTASGWVYVSGAHGIYYVAHHPDDLRADDIEAVRVGLRVTFLPRTDLAPGHKYRRARRLVLAGPV